MTTTKASLSHLERTATEPRDESLHKITLSKITPINENIRLFQLTPLDGPIRHLPGQWLDLHIPSLPKPGGFTITSPPSLSITSSSSNPAASPSPFLELAVQQTSNPPATWLFQSPSKILGTKLDVRVGGGFVWPPCHLPSSHPPSSALKAGEVSIKRVVFIAGGVGVNPLMSMLSSITDPLHTQIQTQKGDGEAELPFEVRFLYSTKLPASGNMEEILFLERLVGCFRVLGGRGVFTLILTGEEALRDGGDVQDVVKGQNIQVQQRRITEDDLLSALGPKEDRAETIIYVCGVPDMTDTFVERIQEVEGIRMENVLSERWW